MPDSVTWTSCSASKTTASTTFVPRDEEELEETDGTALQDWFNGRNRITRGNLKRVVRILKHLRDHKGNFQSSVRNTHSSSGGGYS